MNETAVIISILVGSVAILTAIFKLIRELVKMRDNYKRMEMCAIGNEKDINVLTKASLAILDGLKQLNCNGRVSEMHKTLLDYLVDK